MFHPNAPVSYRNSSIPSLYRRHELQRKREYGKRVREVEQASLVFSTTGGMGGEALTFYRRIADMLSRHRSTSYSGTLAWIRCTLSFSLLHSATMCIRGTQSILPTILPRKWAILLALGTFSCPLSVVQHTCSLVLGVVGKGSTSSPGKKNFKVHTGS